MSSLYYKSTFYSDLGQDWKIEIKAKTLTAGNEIEFNLKSDGFKLKYDKGKDEKISQIKQSKVTFGFIVKDQTDRDGINEILNYKAGEFYVVIYRGTIIYYTGWIKPSFNRKTNEFYPYTSNVDATDSLNRILNKYNNILYTNGPADFTDLYNPLKVFYDTFDITSLPINSFSVKSLFKFWPAAIPYTTATDAMRILFYNRNAFVNNQGNQPNTIQNYLIEFNGLLKSFGMSLIYSNNTYHFIQDNALVLDQPFYWISQNPLPTATSFRDDSAVDYTPITIDNSLSISNTAGNILNGATFSNLPELNSVRGTYNRGTTTALFDPDNSYSGLTTIGFINAGQTALNLNLSLKITEVWPDSVTPHGSQNSFLTGVVACQLQVGNRYLSSNGAWGQITSLGWEWSTDPNSEFFLASGMGITDSQQWQFLTQTSTIITQYDSDNPTGFDTAHARMVSINLNLPSLISSGEVKFKMQGKIYYWQLPGPGITYAGGNVPIVTLIQGLNTFSMPVSTGLNWSQNPTSRTIEILQTPILSSLTEGNLWAQDDNNEGSLYIAGQNPSTQNIDKNLGAFSLGNLYTEDSTQHTIRMSIAPNSFVDTGGFDVETGSVPKNLTQLVLNQYLLASNKPTTILSGSIRSRLMHATRPIKYKSDLDGAVEKYLLIQGTFTAANDTFTGSWYRLDVASIGINEVQTNLFYPDFPPVIDPGSTGVPAFNPLSATALGGFNTSNIRTPEKAITQNYYNNSTIGIVTTELPAATAATTIDIGYIRGKVYTGQKLMLTDPYGNNALEITTYNKSEVGDSHIDANFTTLAKYPVGSLVLINSYDVSNVITGDVSQIVAGTNISISPAGGTGVVTINSTGGGGTPSAPTNSVQFNDGGNFGGESAFTYLAASNNLFVTNTNSHFFGTNIGHRSYFDPVGGELWIFLHAQDFDLGDTSRYFIYSRDGSDTVMNGFDSRAPMRIASTYLPIGYRLLAYEVYTNAARPLYLKTSPFNNTATNLLDTGTTNTINALSTPYTTNPGEYFSLLVQADRSTTQVLGGRLRLQKL